MTWVRPDDVKSPIERWELLAVLYDAGPGEAAIAYGRWDGSDVIAARWNGSDDPGKALGNPQSTAHATWFVLPETLANATLHILLEKQAAGDAAVRSQAVATAVRALGFKPGL